MRKRTRHQTKNNFNLEKLQRAKKKEGPLSSLKLIKQQLTTLLKLVSQTSSKAK